MKIAVIRQACCSADDQINALDSMYEVDASITVDALLQKICASNFLQYSSTHSRLSVEVAGRQLAEVGPSGILSWSANVSGAELAMPSIGKNTLHFFFRPNAIAARG